MPWANNILVQDPKFTFAFFSLCRENIEYLVLYRAQTVNKTTCMSVLLSVKAVNSDYSDILKPWATNLLVQEPKCAFVFLNLCIENVKNQVLYKSTSTKAEHMPVLL